MRAGLAAAGLLAFAQHAQAASSTAAPAGGETSPLVLLLLLLALAILALGAMGFSWARKAVPARTPEGRHVAEERAEVRHLAIDRVDLATADDASFVEARIYFSNAGTVRLADVTATAGWIVSAERPPDWRRSLSVSRHWAGLDPGIRKSIPVRAEMGEAGAEQLKQAIEGTGGLHLWVVGEVGAESSTNTIFLFKSKLTPHGLALVADTHPPA